MFGVSLLICSLIGISRGLMRQVVSIGCCLAALLCAALLGPLIAKAIGISPASFGNVVSSTWLLTWFIFLIVAARIVHLVLQTRMSARDRALGSLLGFVRGFGAAAFPLLFLFWLVPDDKLPDSVRNSLSFPLLNNAMTMMPASLQPGDLLSRFDAGFWSVVIGLSAVLSVPVDLFAAATRRWRLRRLDRKYRQRKSPPIESPQLRAA
jgi:uncharacterized membrane protein required for colicin V production